MGCSFRVHGPSGRGRTDPLLPGRCAHGHWIWFGRRHCDWSRRRVHRILASASPAHSFRQRVGRGDHIGDDRRTHPAPDTAGDLSSRTMVSPELCPRMTGGWPGFFFGRALATLAFGSIFGTLGWSVALASKVWPSAIVGQHAVSLYRRPAWGSMPAQLCGLI